MNHLRTSGAASTILLAILAGCVALAGSGAAVVSRSAPAKGEAAVPADPIAAIFAAPAQADCAAHVAGLAAVVADDSDPRHAEAIVALRVAGTPEARVALRAIVARGAAADADLAERALGGVAVP